MTSPSSHDNIPSFSSSSNRNPTTFTIPDPASVEEHGRTFTAYREGKYHLPNDGDEQDRLDFQHKGWLLMMKGDLYWAPIGKPKNVLDIGTGTGIWAINFARLHPQAHVIGTDLSLIQPPTLPPNCEFIRDDIEDPWAFQTPFDFVHLRMMFTCFQNPKHVMQTIYDNLEPGGWVEYQDTGLEIVGENAASEEYIRASKLTQWADIFKVGMLKTTGRDIGISRKYQSWMTEIGFVDVTEKPILVPINSWPLDPDDQFIGHFSRRNVGKVVESSFKFLLAGGMTEAELPSFQDDVKWCLGDTMMRGFWIGYVVYGRKPASS